MTVERRERMSYEEFARSYMIPGRPVIIEEAMPEWAAYEWTPQKLIEILGDHPVRIGPDHVPFSQVMDDVLASSDENPGPYLRNLDIKEHMPKLWPDVSPRLRYALPNWKASSLMPSGWIFPDDLTEIFVGGKGNGFPNLHYDWWGMHVFITQIYGNKEVMVCPPEDTPYVYPTDENPLYSNIKSFSPDLERFPLFKQAHPHYVTLKPRDTLFVPPGWWHITYMPDVSITIITHNWNATNWQRFIDDVVRRGVKTRSAKMLAAAAYMAGVGKALALRDRLRGWPKTP